MDILWDSKKNDWLIINRNISFEEISEIILKKEYKDIIENPTRSDQYCFVIELSCYIWIVPFIIDEQKNIILKTAFPSRKYNKIFGEGHEKNI